MARLLFDAFKDPSIIKQFNISDWSNFIADARQQKVLGRFYWLFQISNLLSEVPEKAYNQLLSAYKVASQQKINVQRELAEIGRHFEQKQLTPIILKGAAYIAKSSPCSHGRAFNDIDIMVLKPSLNDAEIALMLGGWVHKSEDDYDKQYYRKWTHEIQPMIHIERMTVVDLHHNILPPTNRSHFAATLLHTQSSKFENTQTLSDVDIFIHSALHLLTEGEFSHPFRDITDLCLLLDDIESEYKVEEIKQRAKNLGVEQYVNLALHLCEPLSTSVTKQPLSNLKPFTRFFTLKLLKKVMYDDNVVATGLKHKICLLMLFIRGHILRMPLYILIPHLLKKALKDKSHKRDSRGDWQ